MVTRMPRLEHRDPTLNRRQLLGWSVGLGLVLAGTGTAQGYAPAQLNRVGAKLAGLQTSVRVALLADLHYGPYIGEKQLAGWVDLTLAARPDLILVLGDFCDVRLSGGLPTPLLRQLARLQAPLGVYGVWGNHDYDSFGQSAQHFTGPARPDWPQTRAAFQAALESGGLNILTNGGVLARPDLWLGGIDDLSCGRPDVAAALRLAPAGAAHLLMCHEPDTLMTLAAAPEWRPDGLAVSGHTHGGQIRLPGVGALKVPSAYGQRFAQGWVQGDPQNGWPGARGYVSRGLGLTGLPVRNLCPPEVVLLELSPAF